MKFMKLTCFVGNNGWLDHWREPTLFSKRDYVHRVTHITSYFPKFHFLSLKLCKDVNIT